MRPPYLSHTQLQMHRMCQRRYELHYIEGVAVPASGEMIRGSAYHKALEFAYMAKTVYHEVPDISEVLQVYSDNWDKSIASRIYWDEEDDESTSIPSVEFKDKDPGKMKDGGTYLLRMYYHGLYQKVIQQEIKEIEARKIANYDNIPLLGFIDLRLDDGTIIDHKLTSKAYSQAQLDTNTQSSFYGILMSGDNIEFHIHQAIARSNPDIVDILIKRSHDDLDWMGSLIIGTWQQIQSGLFVPNPYGWWCSPDQCGYWAYCHMPKGF